MEHDEDSRSQPVELYDFIPKYVWGKVERVSGKFLDSLKREFECRGRKYLLTLMPARIEVGDEFKEFYPSKREELVEDALRKLMKQMSVILSCKTEKIFDAQPRTKLVDASLNFSRILILSRT